ncbi:uncharacterized protein [Musca autumnalis]|uniref:uncharacterized protein n=1 Tax=Musca autumnalis TaxID=221902 RepID=UPI003CEF6481
MDRPFCDRKDETTLLMIHYKVGVWENLYRFIKVIATNHKISINEKLTITDAYLGLVIGYTQTKADSYFYSINPALAIIINNYYFTSAKKVRHGSEEDMCRVMKVLKCAQIPFIILQDCTREEYLRIMEYIKHCNFHPIKTFMLFLMSHGDRGNIIYTRDGHMHLFEDVVAPIEANKSLTNVQKLLVGNFCRGPIDYEYATSRQLAEINEHYRNIDLKKIQPTNCCQQLSENFTLMFSVPDGVRSPRDPQLGSPYMEKLCEIFPTIDHNKDLRNIHKNIDQNLKNVYYYGEAYKRSDIVVGNPAICQTISRLHIEASQMIELFKKLREDFTELLRQGEEDDGDDGNEVQNQPKSLFYICGRITKIPDNNLHKYFMNKYFSKQLDGDDKE